MCKESGDVLVRCRVWGVTYISDHRTDVTSCVRGEFALMSRRGELDRVYISFDCFIECVGVAFVDGVDFLFAEFDLT